MRRAYYNGVISMFSNVTRRSALPAAAAILAWALSLGAAAADIAPVTRVEPEFPREAISAGADKGRVKARMTVDARPAKSLASRFSKRRRAASSSAR
jgi:hypothetical protein